MKEIINNIITILDQFYCFNKDLYIEDYENNRKRITRWMYVDNEIHLYSKSNFSTDDEDEIVKIIDISENLSLQIKDNKIIINNITIELLEED